MANTALFMAPVIVGGALAMGGARGCSRVSVSDKPDVFQVGDCLRDNEHMGAREELGYFKLVVDKTSTTYILCQGQFGKRENDRVWYGCDLGILDAEFYNSHYTKVQCPNWRIEDEVYGDER